MLLTKRQKEQLTDKQPHAENIFGHPPGVRQIGLKPHGDLAHRQGCDQGDLDIQKPRYSLALEKRDVLRSRGHGTCFVRFPTQSSDAARTPSVRHVSPGRVQGPGSMQFPYRAAMLCNVGELAPFFIFPSRELFTHITVAL